MKPESEAWRSLADCAAAQLRPGFAMRVMQAARAHRRPAALSFADQLSVSAATAVLFLLLIMVLHEHMTQAASIRNRADWRQIVAESENVSETP